MQEDESKIKWCQFIDGDKEAYSWIYKVYIQLLFQYGKRFTSDTELIKDCIQELFTKLYNNRKRLVIPDNIKVYLLISLKNCLINAIYQASHYERYNSETISFSLELTVEEQYVNNEHYQNQLKRLQDILALLPPRQKEIIYYRYIQELSFDEICSIMDMNYQSAQNLIQRSLKKIRDTYGSVDIFLLLLSISIR